MTNSYKLALLAALGLAGFVSSTQAQTYNAGDLIVGIYEPSAANTLVVDLGSAASITGQTYQQWNLGSYLTSAGITLSGSAQYGVVGATGAANGSSVYSTGIGSPSWTSGQVAAINSTALTIGQYISGGYVATSISGGGGLDWYNETIVTPPASGTLIATVLGTSLNSTVGTSTVLYRSIGSYSTGRPPHTVPGSEVTDLAFDLTPDGTLTYGTAAVPEPSTYGLIAGAGLLALSLRNKLVRKQA